MTITYQKEFFAKIMGELPDLMHPHWEEVADDKDVIKLNPTWGQYIVMEAQGIYHMLTVRDDGILIGYYGAMVMPHLRYKDSLTAWSDMFYLRPAYRKDGKGLHSYGYKLIVEAEKMLKALKVQKTYLMTTERVPINIIMKRRRYKLAEAVYSKLL